jgi:hypothetical protein
VGALVAAGVMVACGARTSIGIGGVEGVEAGLDGAVADGNVVDTGDGSVVDVIVTDAGCNADPECDDGVACTLDRCDLALRVCTHLPRPAQCDDGVFCNGAEVCDPKLGCAAGPPPSCSDGIACSVDSCNEGKKGCDHAPDDTLCPISHTCDLQLGCQARALAHSGNTLYEIRLPSGQVKTVGGTGPQLTDVALHPSNVLYGIGFNALYTVNQTTGVATFFKSTSTGNINAADVAPGGVLYVAGDTSLYTLNLVTGVATFVASFPPGRASSGDLAFVGPRLLASSTSAGGEELVEFDVNAKTSKVLGPIGFTCVWGLAGFGPTLYGLTCNGQVLAIDVITGKGTLKNQVPNVTFWGASAR